MNAFRCFITTAVFSILTSLSPANADERNEKAEMDFSKYEGNSQLLINDAYKARCADTIDCVIRDLLAEGPAGVADVVIDYLEDRGFVQASRGADSTCDTGGPIYSQTAYCVDSSTRIYAHNKSPLAAFVCYASSAGVSANVGVVCDPDRLLGDIRDPAPSVGGGPGAAIAVGLMDPTRGLTVTYSGITAGLSVQGVYYINGPRQ